MAGCGRRGIPKCVTSEGIQVTSASSLSYDLEVIVPLGSELTSLHLGCLALQDPALIPVMLRPLPLPPPRGD